MPSPAWSIPEEFDAVPKARNNHNLQFGRPATTPRSPLIGYLQCIPGLGEGCDPHGPLDRFARPASGRCGLANQTSHRPLAAWRKQVNVRDHLRGRAFTTTGIRRAFPDEASFWQARVLAAFEAEGAPNTLLDDLIVDIVG